MGFGGWTGMVHPEIQTTVGLEYRNEGKAAAVQWAELINAAAVIFPQERAGQIVGDESDIDGSAGRELNLSRLKLIRFDAGFGNDVFQFEWKKNGHVANGFRLVLRGFDLRAATGMAERLALEARVFAHRGI